MTFEEVIKKFEEIFDDVLETEDVELKYETTAADIEEWDSLNHIQLVVEIEKTFKVQFGSAEIQAFQNVGEMVDAIVAKLN